MKKAEFLNRLSDELNKRRVTDAEDIVEEYRQHFDLKLADGFFEEEIAARLGDPAMPAALIALALFAACFVLAYVVCALSAGSFQFWHVWGWFAN